MFTTDSVKDDPPRWPVKGTPGRSFFIGVYVRHQREYMIKTAQNVLNRHLRRVRSNKATTLTANDVTALQDYIGRLEASKRNKTFHTRPNWPAIPYCLRDYIIT